MKENKKTCPFCGEEILAVAKKCKHCGEYLDKSAGKDAFSKKEIEEIYSEINSLRDKELMQSKKTLKKIKEECDEAIDKCEHTLDSITRCGYVPFQYFEHGVVALLFVFLIIGGLGSGNFWIGLGLFIVLTIVWYLYFLPSDIAFRNGHKQAWVILIINLFFGELLLPWIIALFWALTSKGNTIVTAEQSDRIRNEVLPMVEKLKNKMDLAWEEIKKESETNE